MPNLSHTTPPQMSTHAVASTHPIMRFVDGAGRTLRIADLAALARDACARALAG